MAGIFVGSDFILAVIFFAGIFFAGIFLAVIFSAGIFVAGIFVAGISSVSHILANEYYVFWEQIRHFSGDFPTV